MATGKAGSIRQLAAAVGRSKTAVAGWVRHPRWNQSRVPPFDIETARVWAQTQLAPNPADPAGQAHALFDRDSNLSHLESGIESLRRNPLAAAKLKLMLIRAQKLEIEKGILSGDFVSRAEVQAGRVRRVVAVRTAFEALPRRIADDLVGQTALEIERILQDEVDLILNNFARGSPLPAQSLEEHSHEEAT